MKHYLIESFAMILFGLETHGPARLLSVLMAALVPCTCLGQPAAPPPPSRYKVEIRYRIFAGTNDRIVQFTQMVKYLESIGFDKDAGPDDEIENPAITTMTGTIGPASIKKILLEPHVKEILLMPGDYALPEESDRQVKVQLSLVSGLPPDRQRLLAQQAGAKLAGIGFHEAVGYDHRGHTRVVGSIAAGQLATLLKDLRWQPSGWLVSDVPVAQLPAPIRNVSPIVAIEVMREEKPNAKEKTAEEPPAGGRDALQKISPDLAKRMAAEALAKPTRIEVILNYVPGREDQDWERQLSARGLAIEGRLGPLVTGVAYPKQAALLAEIGMVSVVRLPRPARPQLAPLHETGAGNQEALRATGLGRLQGLGHRGKDIRVAVVDGDFRGWERFKGKQLPSALQLVDLTAQCNEDLKPDPYPDDARVETGHGTQCALAVALAAPAAQLTLIRIDPAAPYQLQDVARHINGDLVQAFALDRRNRELTELNNELAVRREKLTADRRYILDHATDADSEIADVQTAYLKKRAQYEHDEAALSSDQTTYQERLERYLQLHRALQGLKGIQIVSSSLVWNDGYPLGDSSLLSRYFDERPFRAALWFQSAGNTHGQTWSDLFRDVDGNGVMEFAPATVPLRPERWTSELNFLAWKPPGQEKELDLPANATIHLSIQWREAHDPEFYRRGEDRYLHPLAHLRLVVLRQRDPIGQKLPADDLEVVARSEGLAQRLENRPSAATYEQTVEFSVESAGRYAVRVEGEVPSGTRPPDVATLPVLQTSWELWPRIFVDAVDRSSRATGRPVFLDYPTNRGSVGVPADSRGLITVGAAAPSGESETDSASGAPVHVELLNKPDILMYDRLSLVSEGSEAAYGANLAAPFAAGLASAELSAGMARADLLHIIQARQGKALQAP